MTDTFAIPETCTAKTVSPTKTRAAARAEAPEERAARLYDAEGGPLIGWLLDECERRGQPLREMAVELDVTYSYIHQLRTGVRRVAHISPEVARACSKYLAVPPIVVKLLAGQIPMSDFAWPHETEEEVIDRALDNMRRDLVARSLLPSNVKSLPLAAKRALVALYMESSTQDILGVNTLPDVLQWLQRAAVVHNEAEGRTAHVAATRTD